MSICGKGYRLCYDSVACRLCQTLQQQTERRCHLQGTEARLKNEEPSRGFLVGHVNRTELALRKGQDLESSEESSTAPFLYPISLLFHSKICQ